MDNKFDSLAGMVMMDGWCKFDFFVSEVTLYYSSENSPPLVGTSPAPSSWMHRLTNLLSCAFHFSCAIVLTQTSLVLVSSEDLALVWTILVLTVSMRETVSVRREVILP